MAFQVIDQIYDATDEVVNDIALRAGIKGNAFAEPCEERAAYLAKCLSRSDEVFQLKVVDDKIVGVRKKPLACPNITAVMDILPTHNGYGASLGKTLTSWYFSPDIMQLEYEYKALKAENGYNVYVQVQDSENGESSLIIRAGYKIGDVFVTTQSATYRHDKPLPPCVLKAHLRLKNQHHVDRKIPYNRHHRTYHQRGEPLVPFRVWIYGFLGEYLLGYHDHYLQLCNHHPLIM